MKLIGPQPLGVSENPMDLELLVVTVGEEWGREGIRLLLVYRKSENK